MANSRGRGIAVVFGALVGIGGCGGVLAAEDAPSASPADENLAKVAAWEAGIAEHLAAKDDEALRSDAKQGVSLHAAAPEKDPLRGRVLKALARLTRHKDDDVAERAIESLGETKDAAAATHVKAFLRAVDAAEVPARARAAIRAARRLAAESLVEPLLAILDDSKNFEAAADAVKALGAFRECRKKRERIVEEVVKSVLRDKPGGQRAGVARSGSQDEPYQPGQTANTASRWQTLATPMVACLNELTGRTFTTPEEWFVTFRAHKNRLADLFEGETRTE